VRTLPVRGEQSFETVVEEIVCSVILHEDTITDVPVRDAILAFNWVSYDSYPNPYQSMISYSGLTQLGSPLAALSLGPYLCRSVKTGTQRKKVMIPCAAKHHV
jgi:hypothetical protein